MPMITLSWSGTGIEFSYMISNPWTYLLNSGFIFSSNFYALFSWKTSQLSQKKKKKKSFSSLVKSKVSLKYSHLSSNHCSKSVVNITFPEMLWHFTNLILREASRKFLLTLNAWIIGITLVFLIASFHSRFTEYTNRYYLL